MLFILLSLLATITFGFILILVVNYALVNWENTKINDLASQIKHNEQSDDILSKGSASHRFTSVDVSDNLRPKLTHQKSFSETAGDFYGKTMTVIKTQDYAGWWQKFTSELGKLRKDWWGTLKRWFGFLFSLAKPVEDLISDDDKIKQQAKEEKHKAEIFNVVEKVKESNRDLPDKIELDTQADASKTFSLVGDEMDSRPKVATQTQAVTDSDGGVQDNADQNEATISLGASFDVDKKPQDMTQFEKLEQKILNRLQESGLKNYDIWIQLGDFYLKYDEKDKAKEIFALVLKQANGEQKEVARNRLISF